MKNNNLPVFFLRFIANVAVNPGFLFSGLMNVNILPLRHGAVFTADGNNKNIEIIIQSINQSI
jgi:hypothetical protein